MVSLNVVLLLLLLITQLGSIVKLPGVAFGATVIFATVDSIDPSLGSNTMVTPAGSGEESPNFAFDFENALERTIAMETSFDSPGLRCRLFSARLSINSFFGFSVWENAVSATKRSDISRTDLLITNLFAKRDAKKA
jgi:hypothetical protein